MPFGRPPGITGFGLNRQVAFAGNPVQASWKLSVDPETAYIVRGITRLCPAVTFNELGGGGTPNPATSNVRVAVAEALAANAAPPP